MRVPKIEPRLRHDGTSTLLPMATLLIHVTHGPESPTRAALGFLVARTALDEGHDVSLFLAGDAVQLLRDAVLDNLNGLGTGSLRESYEAIVAGGGRFYLSGMSSKGRGVTEVEIEGKPAELAPPNRLVQLLVESDHALTY
jgi:predicted peroxiredoxin